jgi:hypothetical protein
LGAVQSPIRERCIAEILVMISLFWTAESSFELSLIIHGCMSYALNGHIRWLNPLNFFPIFMLLGFIGNYQRAGIWRKVKKKVKITAPLWTVARVCN